MQTINTSNSTFSNFREGGFLYVDKTAILHQWVRHAQGQYFLTRPRRFGKSLMISTLKSIFQGRRELFKGLALEGLDYDWKTYPVIHLNMASCMGATCQEVEQGIDHVLAVAAKDNGAEVSGANLPIRFDQLIRDLAERAPVVVLVDEYDKPLLGHLGKSTATEIQNLLKSFYGVIKTTEDKLRFAMITGVSKFSKVSIFSDLNNLTDLSLHRESATLLGYTQEELEANFAEYIDAFAPERGESREQVLEQLKYWYNGYRFEEGAPTVYNPVSVMKCLSERKFNNYWFETGTPSFLIELLKRQPMTPDQDFCVPASAFGAYEPNDLQALPLLVQTGYLTILGSQVFGEEVFYELGYPNHEVEISFSRMLTKGLGGAKDPELGRSMMGVVKALNAGDIDQLMKHLKVFFAGIPYDIQLSNEKYYQTLFFAVFRMLGSVVEAEVRSADGRVDATLKTPERIVIFEFKLHDTAQNALEQINSKDYSLPYEDDGRQIIKVGVGFDAETRNIGEWVVG